ncbi:class I SAM-dependent methyltransferase [Endozoicomonas sp. OPT23]|uniref:class I SAM-dependent methyltransferase n=1 Tax=Endozoicomonas sp. OPT23 TaxID=2072845 RepID=UPI001E539AFE|nr:class I SAM-dependent methyltransferase [Endozoicomonas sp. OPT23]
MVFVPPHEYISTTEEHHEYLLHENNPDDGGYRRFLSRLTQPLTSNLKPASKGLDFGCGPGPTLHLIMSDHGHTMHLYDIFFHKDKSVLNEKYDFITATEVVEHIHHPSDVISQLWSLLNIGGYLAIMTKLVIDQEAFSRWHYKNDPTHVCFYSIETFNWLAKELNAEIEFIDRDVIFLRKAE